MAQIRHNFGLLICLLWLCLFSHRAVQRMWGQLQLSAHHRWGWWAWHLHWRLLSDATNREWPYCTWPTCYICTNFPFQMKPQEKVFFKDPVKLIQSRLEHISQVCLLCAAFTPSSLIAALFNCYTRMLNVKGVSQLINSQWVIQQEISSVRLLD